MTLLFQIPPLFWWNYSPNFKAKKPGMRHIMLVPTPRFEMSESIKMLVRHPILDVGCTFYSFSRKHLWQILRLHHASGHLHERSILPLSNTILLRCLGNRVLHLDTCIFKILNNLIHDILTIIIISEDVEFSSGLVLN